MTNTSDDSVTLQKNINQGLYLQLGESPLGKNKTTLIIVESVSEHAYMQSLRHNVESIPSTQILMH